MAKEIQHPNKKVKTEQTEAFPEAEVLRPTDEQIEITQAIEKVNKANEASVLMSLMCNTLGLNAQSTTHVEFVTKFTELQKESIDAQKMLAEKFVTVPVPEKRRKNAKMKYQ